MIKKINIYIYRVLTHLILSIILKLCMNLFQKNLNKVHNYGQTYFLRLDYRFALLITKKANQLEKANH